MSVVMQEFASIDEYIKWLYEFAAEMGTTPEDLSARYIAGEFGDDSDELWAWHEHWLSHKYSGRQDDSEG